MAKRTSERLIADRYALARMLGRGGMGVVWRARDVLLDRDVAIKEVQLPPSLNSDERQSMRARVLREARAAARLNHPNVVTLYDVVREEGRTFIVMELVEAPTLAAVVHERGPLPTLTAVVNEPPRPPRRAGRLEPVLLALLAKAPEQRPSAGQLRPQLERIAGRGARRVTPTVVLPSPPEEGHPTKPLPAVPPPVPPAAEAPTTPTEAE